MAQNVHFLEIFEPKKSEKSKYLENDDIEIFGDPADETIVI